nr:ubiquitin-conjugating enzyme E2 Z-like [Rhipicephalus microplus]
MQKSWTESLYSRNTPSRKCLERVTRDLADHHADPPPGVFMAPEEDNVTTVHAVVMGAAGTSYQGGFFHLLMKCTNDYPMSPPQICLSLLGTMIGQPWTPAHNLSSVALSIQSMLDDAINCVDAALEHVIFGYWGPASRRSLRYETLRVAVCGTIESCLEDDCPFPAVLRDQLLAKFAEDYASNEAAAKEELVQKRGGSLCVPPPLGALLQGAL